VDRGLFIFFRVGHQAAEQIFQLFHKSELYLRKNQPAGALLWKIPDERLLLPDKYRRPARS